MRKILKTVTVLVAVSALVPVCAQEVAARLGGAHDSSNGAQIDTFGDGTLHKTPSLDGLFLRVGASVFFGKHIGVGGEYLGGL